MTTLNLTPILQDNQPTTHLRIGRSKVGPSEGIVAVKHNDAHAFFRVDPEDDTIANSIQTKAIMHTNVGEVFGGVDRDRGFIVDTDVSMRDIHQCKSVELHAPRADEERLRSVLVERNVLLHYIDEVIEVDGELVEVSVERMEPSGYTTLGVDSGTDITFVDESAGRDADATGGPGRSAGGGRDGGGRGGGRGDDEDEVDIDLTPKKPTSSFEEDVAGLETVKRTARTMLAMFDPDEQSRVEQLYGEEFASRGGSMLLYGPPGCGKTLVSEAIAHEAKEETDIEAEYGDVKFLEVKGGDVLSRYPGESERRIEAVFDQAHRVAQDGFAVLFFDEVETLIPDRSDDSLQRHERSLTNAFLQEMNDIEDNLLVIGATNMPFTIDPAATRRFPIQQFIPQPDAEVMAQVWEVNLRSLPNAEEIDFRRLGEASVGYTPAEIADRVLGSDLQREFVESVVRDDREAIEPDTEYLLEWLEDTEPKTVRQYVSSVREQIDDLEGYPEMQRYVEEQAEKHGISLGNGGGFGDRLAAALGGGSEGSPDGANADAGGGPEADADAGAGPDDDSGPTGGPDEAPTPDADGGSSP